MNRINRIGVSLILLALSIDNKFFLAYSFWGIGIVDVCLLFGLLFLFIGNNKIRENGQLVVSHYFFIMSLGGVFVLFFSLIKQYELFYLIADVRNYIFLVASYVLFRKANGAKEYVAKVIPWFSLLNCIVFLGVSNYLTGQYQREIYTPLWISVIAIGCILLNENSINPVRYFVAVIAIITILISQTRSYIFPIIIILACYTFRAVNRGKSKSIILVFIVCLSAYFYFSTHGLMDMISYRMIGSFDKASTLWLRFENSIQQLQNMDFLEWIWGRGFGDRFYVIQYDLSFRETSDLEMLFFNQIIEFGLPLFLYNTFYFFINGYKGYLVSRNYTFMIITIAVVIGGCVSGLVGANGSIIYGMLLGMIGHESSLLL